MENAIKKICCSLFVLLSLAVLPTQATPGPFLRTTMAVVSCTPPNPGVTSQSSNSVSFGWSSVLGASGYRVWYSRNEDHYTSSPVSTGYNYISFNSLPAGTYTFYFATDCGNELSQPAIVIDIIMI